MKKERFHLDIILTLGTLGYCHHGSRGRTWPSPSAVFGLVFCICLPDAKASLLLEGTENWRKGLEIVPSNPLGVFFFLLRSCLERFDCPRECKQKNDTCLCFSSTRVLQNALVKHFGEPRYTFFLKYKLCGAKFHSRYEWLTNE